MHRPLALAVMAAMLAAGPVFAEEGGGASSQSDASQANGKQQMSQQDRQWLDYAATDNQGEIQQSLFAEKKAQSLALKAFVRLMVNDHVQLESQLAALVNGQSVSVPTGPGEKATKLISEMQNLQGSAFDRRFIAEQIKDHGDDIRKFSEEIQKTHDPAIRHFASEGLPMLKQHLALAKAVQASMKEGGE